MERRPRSTSPMFAQRRRPRFGDQLPPGRVLVDLLSPGDSGFAEAVHRAARILKNEHLMQYALIATMPEHVRQNGKKQAATDDELAKLDMQPWAITVAKDDDSKPRVLFNVAAGDNDIPAATTFAEVISLFPKIVRAFLAVIRPWHFALLGVKGFEDVERPSNAELAAAAATAIRTFKKWGIGLEVVDGPGPEDRHGS